MYERDEPPNLNANKICQQYGKVIKPTVDCLKVEPIWTEVCLRQCTRIRYKAELKVIIHDPNVFHLNFSILGEEGLNHG